MSKNVTGKVKIERIKRYTNGGRKYTILIDGNKIGAIKNGETFIYSVTKGQHVIKAKIDWLCSKPFQIEINPGKMVNLFVDCSNFRTMDVLVLLVICGLCAGLGAIVIGMLGAAIGGGVGGFVYAHIVSRPYVYEAQQESGT